MIWFTQNCFSIPKQGTTSLQPWYGGSQIFMKFGSDIVCVPCSDKRKAWSASPFERASSFNVFHFGLEMGSAFRNKGFGTYSPGQDMVKSSRNMVWIMNEFSVPTNGSRDPQQEGATQCSRGRSSQLMLGIAQTRKTSLSSAIWLNNIHGVLKATKSPRLLYHHHRFTSSMTG
jgi:hypothetical protein